MRTSLLKLRKKYPLKIAQVSPVIERVPPKKYGGTERVVYTLTEELIKRGHKVTLFASGDSITSAKLYSVYPRALREAKIGNLYGNNELTLLNIEAAFNRQNQFDIIHDHNAPTSLPTANLSKTPVVSTIHGPLTSTNKRLFEESKNVHFVTISKAQKIPSANFKVAKTIYHGISDVASYPFGEESGDYLLFVGRLSMEKGVHHAIEVAQYLNIPLILAAKLDSIDLTYFNEYVEPKLSDHSIKWVGEVDETERNELMSKALCFLHPVTWREPFGLTLVEAMACGCPVVGFNKGSIPEIIENGKNGYLVEDVEQMIHAVEKIKKIDRNYCRKYALGNFNAQKMADKYETLYYKILGKT